MHAKLRSPLSRLSGADAMVLQSIVGEKLAQGPCVAARRAGFEPATLRTQGTDPTTEPSRPTSLGLQFRCFDLRFDFLSAIPHSGLRKFKLKIHRIDKNLDENLLHRSFLMWIILCGGSGGYGGGGSCGDDKITTIKTTRWSCTEKQYKAIPIDEWCISVLMLDDIISGYNHLDVSCDWCTDHPIIYRWWRYAPF